MQVLLWRLEGETRGEYRNRGCRGRGVLPCGYIGRREDDWEILKWFQGIRERLMNEVVEAYDGPFVMKCDYP